MRTLWVGLAALMVMAPLSAQAQDRFFGWGNYRAVLLGGQTAALGGTGVAAGTDSAMPYLNPAGLAAVGQHHISMSASVYSLTALEVTHNSTNGLPTDHSDFGKPSTYGPLDRFRSQHLDSFPSSFVYSWPMGKPVGEEGHHVLSFSILVPRRVEKRWEGLFAFGSNGSRQLATRADSSSVSVYQLGPSYAAQVGTSLRLGATLGLLYRTGSSVMRAQTIQVLGRDFYTLSAPASSSSFSFDLKPTVGLQWRASPSVAFGLSVAAPTVPIHSGGRLRSSLDTVVSQGLVLEGADSTNFISSATDMDESSGAQPLSLSAGFEYTSPKRWALAADIHYHHSLDVITDTGETSTQRIFESGPNSSTRRSHSTRTLAEPVVNGNVGLRLHPSETMALSFGFYTDFSANPDLIASTDVSKDQMDLFGVTTGLTVFFGQVDFTIGAAYIFGDGNYGAADDLLSTTPVPERIVPITHHQLTGFITGGVSFGDAIKPIAKATDLPLMAAEALFTQKKPITLKPVDIDISFSSWTDTALDDLSAYISVEGGAPGLSYEQVGVADYDRFFKEAAIIEGALVIANGRLRRIKKGLTALKAAAQGVVAGVEITQNDAALLSLLGAAVHTVEIAQLLENVQRDQKVAFKAVEVLLTQAPKTLKLGARILSEAPERLQREGVSALASLTVAVRNSIRMVRRFKQVIIPVQNELRTLWPKE